MDVFKMDYALNMDERMVIIAQLSETGKTYPSCPTCLRSVDIGFMRKLEGDAINAATCLPCFLKKHSDTNQELLGKIIDIGNLKGWYYD